MNPAVPTPSWHQHAKAICAAFCRRRGFAAHFEAGCDVLGWRVREGRLEFLIIECEKTTRNLIRNYDRNQQQPLLGKTRQLAVVPSEKVARAVRNQLRRCLPAAAARQVAVVMLNRLATAAAG